MSSQNGRKGDRKRANGIQMELKGGPGQLKGSQNRTYEVKISFLYTGLCPGLSVAGFGAWPRFSGHAPMHPKPAPPCHMRTSVHRCRCVRIRGQRQSLGAGAIPPGAYFQTPRCHLGKRPRLRGLPDLIYCTVANAHPPLGWQICLRFVGRGATCVTVNVNARLGVQGVRDPEFALASWADVQVSRMRTQVV